MLADISSVDAIYIVCGRTDMRKSIDGLCAIIQEQFSMEIDHALFLFCGRKCDRIKAILKEPDGIVMIYKRLTAQGSYRWPRNKYRGLYLPMIGRYHSGPSMGTLIGMYQFKIHCPSFLLEKITQMKKQKN